MSMVHGNSTRVIVVCDLSATIQYYQLDKRTSYTCTKVEKVIYLLSGMMKYRKRTEDAHAVKLIEEMKRPQET